MVTLNTEIDKRLYAKLMMIDDRDLYVETAFDYCESQEDREKLLTYINMGHTDRREVLLMTSQIGVESGNAEGEFEDNE